MRRGAFCGSRDEACHALAGRDNHVAGRTPRRLYGTVSSPTEGVISTRPYGSVN